MEFWVISIVFIVIGILTVLYAHRFGRWIAGLGFDWFHKIPWLRISPVFNLWGKTREEAEHQFYDTWPLRGYWLFWLWGIRIMGVLLAIAGMVVVTVLIMQ